MIAVGISGSNNPLTSINFPVSGTYSCSDINFYQIWYNTINSLSGATQFGSNIPCTGTGSQTLSTTDAVTLTASATYYFFISMDVVGSPINGDYITVGALGTGNITTANLVSGSAIKANQQTLYQVPMPPSPATAVPSSICIGASTNLNATSSGNSINWYTVPTSGIPIGTSLSGYNFAITPGSSGTLNYYAESQSWNTVSQTFTSNGIWTVPAGVTNATAYIWGGGGAGGGGNGSAASNGANGGGGGGGACSVNTLTGLTAR